MEKEVITLKKLDGRSGPKINRAVYDRRVEALRDIFSLWGEVSYAALEQHLEDHPGIEESPSSWLPGILEDLQVKQLISLRKGVYSWN